MSSLRQTSFAAGELSPYLHGRTDLDLFGHGARRLFNFLVNRQASAVSRPGTKLAWTAKTNSVVLLPFLITYPGTPDSSVILELGERYLRVYNTTTFALVTELVTPYLATELPELHWAQAGESMVLTHRNHQPLEIFSPGHTYTIWLVQPASFAPGPADTLGGPPLSACFINKAGADASVPQLTPQPRTLPLVNLFVLDAAHPPREWRWKVASLLRNKRTGRTAESLPVDVTTYSDGVVAGTQAAIPDDGLIVVGSDAPVRLTHPTFSAPVPRPVNWDFLGLVWYRGRGDLFGFVGTTRYAQPFIDTGIEPNYLIQPLRGESPFITDEFPATVGYFQQRRAFAGSDLRPSTWWCSAVDQWANFDKPVLNYSGQPLEATMLGMKRERVVSMSSIDHLFIFTDVSVWQVGRKELPLDFDTLPSHTRRIDTVGSLPLQPVDVGNSLLFPVAQGRGVRELRASGDGNFTGVDISWHAEHFFRGANARVVSWCYQRHPWSIVWVVRNDGVLLSCTKTGDTTWAWAQHDTSGDVVLSVTSVPQSDTATDKGKFDDVFMAVVRSGVVCIEQVSPHIGGDDPLEVTDPDYAGNAIGSEQVNYPLDSYVVLNAPGDLAGWSTGGLDHLEGRQVWASCPGLPPQGPLTVRGGEVTLASWQRDPATALKVAIGLPFICEMETLDARPGNANQKTLVAVAFEVDHTEGLEAGEDFQHLAPWQNRTVANSYEYPGSATALVRVMTKGSWRHQGRAVLRLSKPVRLTVLGVTRELAEGGK